MTKKATRSSWLSRFLAVVRYELLWNIRKKKLYGVIAIAFVLVTLTLFLRVILSNIQHQTLAANPNFAVDTGTGLGSFGFFLFALVTVMNSISGEFESGTIVPLLTKPVSRTTIFLGKIFAAFVTLLAAYTILLVYLALGSSVIYGPQNNLQLLPIVLFGSIASTFVWMSIILAVGALSKSSMVAALVGIGLWLGLVIVGSVVGTVLGQTWALSYFPGSGASGYAPNIDSSTSLPINVTVPSGLSVSTGTDGIASNLVTYILHPSAEVNFYKMEFTIGAHGIPTYTPLGSETLSSIIARESIIIVVYVLVFNFIAWFALKRAQIAE